MVEAWVLYDAFLSDARVSLVDEPPSIELFCASIHALKHSRQRFGTTPTWQRSRAGNHKLITFDQGFARYQDLDSAILS